ncbi:hypothetical protein LWI29_005529 [Acer saccharum]|uniref:Alpha 1,4-glycosyltransferase domain-containing protein n=1 Tax=Acer saccharum TaxID=4024 RepID=A0AA39S451_ACESA|nr:hypothetical protein LWI29_005529 [Acer saccharum]
MYLLGRNSSVIFSAITIAAVIFIIYEDSVISNESLQSGVFRDNKENFSGRLKKSTISHITLRSVQEEIENASLMNSLKPPASVTEEERIAWFRKKLPEFEIFKSNNLTEKFHGRVLEFFGEECEIRAFMTWISPARSFGKREVLGLETFFKAHPHGCLMILSRTLDSRQGYRVLKPLLDRQVKLAAVTPDLSFLFKNTPAESWFDSIKSGKKRPCTDVVSGNWTRLNNAVLIFDMNHPLLLKFIEEFATTFDGNKWGHNGPYLVSRVVQRVENRPGFNFTVLPPSAFYPVHWNNIGGLFKLPENRVGLRWVKAKLLQLSGQTYGVHLWNKQSSRLKIDEGSVMGRLISDHCVICEQIYSS